MIYLARTVSNVSNVILQTIKKKKKKKLFTLSLISIYHTILFEQTETTKQAKFGNEDEYQCEALTILGEITFLKL